MRKIKLATSVCGLALVSCNAHAITGVYFSGFGPISSGMGGAAVALPQDVAVAVDNPAGLAFIGDRLDVYGVILRADTKGSFGDPNSEHTSKAVVPNPGFGINYQIDPKWTAGVVVYGAGASSDYGERLMPVPGIGKARAGLTVVNTAPTFTYKPAENFSVGASVIFGVEQFYADGLAAPTPAGLVAVQDHGTKYATGWGLGVGALWQINPKFAVGASYFTEMQFSKLDGYKDDVLAASDGRMNLPERYAIGLAYKPVLGLALAIDYQRINWSKADGFNIGDSFNWQDQDVIQFGVSYDVSPKWTVRTGYSYANAHVHSDYTNANYYAPAINSEAVRVGATYKLDSGSLVSAAFEYNIPRTINGTGPSEGTNIHTNFQVLTIGYSFRY